MCNVGSKLRKDTMDPLVKGLDWRRPEMAGEAVGSNLEEGDTYVLKNLRPGGFIEESGADLWEGPF